MYVTLQLLLIIVNIFCEINTFQVFLPGDEMEEGDELTYDRSAYEMYHAVSLLDYSVDWTHSFLFVCFLAANNVRNSRFGSATVFTFNMYLYLNISYTCMHQQPCR